MWEALKGEEYRVSDIFLKVDPSLLQAGNGADKKGKAPQ